jgi:lipopolysaccharide transport system ATP-binding protein
MKFTGVKFLDVDQTPLIWVVGGEQVTLRVQVRALEKLDHPMIGFTVKDRLGQALFGDNTYLSYIGIPLICEADKELLAEFTFLIPILPAGNYSVNVAIGDGTQSQHIQHHWIHDAVLFKSESNSVSTGLIGIPMHDVKLTLCRNII